MADDPADRVVAPPAGLLPAASLPAASPPAIPRATYRIQLHRGFTFRDAVTVVPYLSALGISHVYCSPYFRARPGSNHGYDVIDSQSFNPEIGKPADFAAFVAALAQHGMGHLMDVVPNHMAVMGADNLWWQDVLENGTASRYADFFDIEWDSPRSGLRGKLLVPALGDHYAQVLQRGELRLAFDPFRGSFHVSYHEHKFPLNPVEYFRILRIAWTSLQQTQDAQLWQQCRALAIELRRLPAAPLDDQTIATRAADKVRLQLQLAEWAESGAAAQAISAAVAGINDSCSLAGAENLLHDLLEVQPYRLAYWRVASDEINYRRFFDVNDLAALRVENERVFDASHKMVFELLRTGAVQGLRIDHPDGLFDPAAYFDRLQDRYCGQAGLTRRKDETPLYVVVEKITAPFEKVPDAWAVHGTTGYRFANLVNGLFVDGAAESKLTRIYHGFTGDSRSYDEVARHSKHLIMQTALASELGSLGERLFRIARQSPETRDYTLTTLQQALTEVIAYFPVYRIYIAGRIAASDRRYVEWAVRRAKRHSRVADGSVFDFVKSVLLCECPPENPGRSAAAMRLFARKLQQVTAPVMAKGVEDTAFYVYVRLLSLNDVGGHPMDFGYRVEAFHGASLDRQRHWPHTLLATSTHDNKRSEDVRARIDVLSEMPAAWRLHLKKWSRFNHSKKRDVDGEAAPSRNDEYMLYQTVLGTFPEAPRQGTPAEAYRDRIKQYMLKAVREAKVKSSWININEEYEKAVEDFIEAVLEPSANNLFLQDLTNFLVPLAWIGRLNSLSAMIIKYTSPGVPDCYQGNETWDFSLVDPDNRRAVDFDSRKKMLDGLQGIDRENPVHGENPEPARQPDRAARAGGDDVSKLYIIWRLLALRRKYPAIFDHGRYCPLQVRGLKAGHVVAYARCDDRRGIVVIAGRLFARLGVKAGQGPDGHAIWKDTRVTLPEVPAGTRFYECLSQRPCEVTEGHAHLSEVMTAYGGAVLFYESPG